MSTIVGHGSTGATKSARGTAPGMAKFPRERLLAGVHDRTVQAGSQEAAKGLGQTLRSVAGVDPSPPSATNSTDVTQTWRVDRPCVRQCYVIRNATLGTLGLAGSVGIVLRSHVESGQVSRRKAGRVSVR